MKKYNFLERALDGQNQGWKYVVTFFVAFLAGAQLIGALPLIIVMMYKTMQSGGNILMNIDNMYDMSVYGISNNFALFLMMIPFIIWLVLTIIMIKVLHKRTFAETVNGTKNVRWNRVIVGAVVWGLITLVWMVLGYYLDKENYAFQLDWAKFIPLLILALIFVPLQTTAEEFFFRGYLTQGIGAETRSRWLALIIPAALFGLMHVINPEVMKFGFWIMMPQYILLGLVFGLTSILDDGIELAMGMHFINNFLACLIITHSAAALQTDAIFEYKNMQPSILDIVWTILMGATALFIFYKKYNWDFSKMNKKVLNHD
jgi:membrane protease YdiL (CAAX protease family)